MEGSDGHFCAGADIAEFETVYRDEEATRDYTRRHPGRAQGAHRARSPDDRGDARQRHRRRPGARALLRPALLRRRRLSRHHARQAWHSLRFRRDAAAGPDHRPGAARRISCSARGGSPARRPWRWADRSPRRAAGAGAGGFGLRRRTRPPQPIFDPRRQDSRRRDRRRSVRGKPGLPRAHRRGGGGRRLRRGTLRLLEQAEPLVPFSRAGWTRRADRWRPIFRAA